MPKTADYQTLHPVLHTNSASGYRIVSTTAEALPSSRTWEVTANATATAPTPATATNNTQIATTAFVKNQKYEPNRGTGIDSIALVSLSTASGDGSVALGSLSTASGDGSIALGTVSKASGEGSVALGALSTASGANSIALGWASAASGVSSIALGALSTASGANSIALGDNASASGNHSTALGAGAEASRDYQISIGTKFVYLRFSGSETQATVYNALSPWINPITGYRQGAIGSFGGTEVTHLHRTSSTTIALFDNSDTSIKTISSGDTTQIGFGFAICTVMY